MEFSIKQGGNKYGKVKIKAKKEQISVGGNKKRHNKKPEDGDSQAKFHVWWNLLFGKEERKSVTTPPLTVTNESAVTNLPTARNSEIFINIFHR